MIRINFFTKLFAVLLLLKPLLVSSQQEIGSQKEIKSLITTPIPDDHYDLVSFVPIECNLNVTDDLGKIEHNYVRKIPKQENQYTFTITSFCEYNFLSWNVLRKTDCFMLFEGIKDIKVDRSTKYVNSRLSQIIKQYITKITLTFKDNSKKPDSDFQVGVHATNNRTEEELTFFISQKGDSGYSYYFNDIDGDDFGDCQEIPVISNSPILGKVTNGKDKCPFEFSKANSGCMNIEENRNWTLSKSYDITGKLIVIEKNYYDNLGRLEQSQSFDFKYNRTFVSQIMYNFQGRPAFQSLSVPTSAKNQSKGFKFINDFVKKENGQAFSSNDLEDENTSDSPTIDKSTHLGKYYNDNPDEPLMDNTSRPYIRSLYSTLSPGTVKQTIGGNKLNGEWRQGYSFSMPMAQEMYYVYGYDYFPSKPSISKTYTGISQVLNNNSNKILWLRATKQVGQDIKGNEVVVFTDTDGKTLGTARGGGTDKYEQLSLIGEQGYVDVHIPKGCANTASLLGSSYQYKIYNLKTEAVVSSSALQTPGFYRVEYTGSKALTKSHQLSYIDTATNEIRPVISDAPGLRYKVNYHNYSLNYYNLAGQLISNLQPVGFNSSCLTKLSASVSHNSSALSHFKYNSLNQLVSISSPDEGTSTFKYRKDGQIRFSQNSEQQSSTSKEYSYTNYDTYSRPVESGIAYQGNSNTSFTPFAQAEPDAEVFTANRKEQHFSQYDFISSAQQKWLKANAGTAYENPTFLSGNIAKTHNTDSSGTTLCESYYSYDIYGRLIWLVQNLKGLGVKTIDYKYHPITGQVTKVYYQKGKADQFIHRYSYDPDTLQLTDVETSTDNSSYTTQASYDYYSTNGFLKRTTLAGGIQGIDYVYNHAGQLKSINHPELSPSKDPGGDSDDLFGMTLDYYHQDYIRSSNFSYHNSLSAPDQYTGNIKAVTWNAKTNKADTSKPLLYQYSYNEHNFLKQADFGKATSSGNITLSDDYKVYGLSYDANGNILSLSRNKHTEGGSNTMDKLSYVYKASKPNQLNHVNDAVSTSTNADDLKDQSPDNYIYNQIGQLTENKKEKTKYKYNAVGLVSEVYHNNKIKVKFSYNDKGFRATKESYNNNGKLSLSTHYITDPLGNTLAIYENQQLKELPIYGLSRLGVYNKTTNTSVYQLTDHLGNVRAVIAKNGNKAVATSLTDYYPFGMPMPGLDIGANQYRYKFQGQEKDTETGKEAFQL
ncbi:MAG: RHS repeat domain-containing protein, partial [Tenacibaculum sp.]